MPLPPRPDPPRPERRKLAELANIELPGVANDTAPSPALAPAELDGPTRARLAAVIANAITSQLGHVRISSIPPEPRSSIRAAAKGAAKGTRIAATVGGMVLSGAVLAGEWVASNYPHAIGPLRALGRIALRMLEAWGAEGG